MSQERARDASQQLIEIEKELKPLEVLISNMESVHNLGLGILPHSFVSRTFFEMQSLKERRDFLSRKLSDLKTLSKLAPISM